MKIHNVKRGFNIPLKGKPEKSIEESPQPSVFGIIPDEFPGIKPKLAVDEGSPVQKGQVLFHDKDRPELSFVSPVAGTVANIAYGPRRKIESISVNSGSGGSVEHRSYTSSGIDQADRGELISLLLKAGLWPFIKQRPFNSIADPAHTPSSLFINAMDTAPLAGDPAYALQESREAFLAGVAACRVLSGGKVYLSINGKNRDSWFSEVGGVEIHAFQGKHPAGLVGTHIAAIDPITHGKIVWHLKASHVAALGSFLLTGEYPSERTVAVAGMGSNKRNYMRTHTGARMEDILRDRVKEGSRIISGNVLTGRSVGAGGFLGFYDDQITLIPEGGKQRFLGWMTPGFNRHSRTNLFLSSFMPGRSYNMDTDLNGEERAFVMTGNYRKVVALDIHPDFLAKAILTEDIDQMEKLGILEVDEEDVALCSYICPSKIEFTEIYRHGLELYAKETS